MGAKKKLPETFEVQINGNPHEVKMSFGMVHTLSAVVGDVNLIRDGMVWMRE